MVERYPGPCSIKSYRCRLGIASKTTVSINAPDICRESEVVDHSTPYLNTIPNSYNHRRDRSHSKASWDSHRSLIWGHKEFPVPQKKCVIITRRREHKPLNGDEDVLHSQEILIYKPRSFYIAWALLRHHGNFIY